MKLVAVSQRVDVHPERGERRDALDQRLMRFLHEAGLLPVAIPNDARIASELMASVQWAGVVFSGGNDLTTLGGITPERDATESVLRQAALRVGLPMIGICRGAQFLISEDGGEPERVEGHVATRHKISGTMDREVNSYHHWALRNCPTGWEALARAEDGTVECARRADQFIWAIMWHPERESPFDTLDIQLFREAFSNNQ